MWRAVLWVGFFLTAGGAAAVETTQGAGAVLRGLDKFGGRVQDIDMVNGASAAFGRLQIELVECRYPVGNATSEGYAYLRILEGDNPEPIYSGWMIASSPALNPLDHARYDVWLLRCNIK
ncbi:MAG: DUF2155 domain-containing protein [Rhodobacterales bacterium]|nr:DUF2155 domain-containing protein [Rhodobacterales bacterium]